MSLRYHIPRSSSVVRFEWPGVDIVTSSCAPISSISSSAGEWLHESREVQKCNLGGCWGENTIDTFQCDRLVLIREIWVAANDRSVALRQTVINRHEEAIELQAMLPLRCEGGDAMAIDGCAAGQWELLLQGRLKNAVPSAVKLGYFDKAYAQAAKALGETGEVSGADDGQPRQVEFDNFGIFRSNHGNTNTHLC